MDIAQVLRNAINNKVAKILKEEYGIETPNEQPVYQVTLLEAGVNREDLIKFIANARMIEPSYAEALVDHVPSVIVRDFTKKSALTIIAELTKLNASSMLERTVFVK